MIPRAYITEWRSHAPWVQDAWVEQDLVISRALVEIFSTSALQQRLAFRGGTALYKLFLRPSVRYSEDIDLVQITPEPIGNTFDTLRSVLDPWLGEPRRQLKEGRVNLLYRFDSEDRPPLPIRLKIEINSREHFSHLGFHVVPFGVTNRWFKGDAEITTYTPNELLGTKLRALYQRKKGRDLFDLWFALENASIDATLILSCFQRYMAEAGHAVTRAQFEANLHAKRT
ncbi:MAG: nucleotidyl transferase AbiEii/AbiGii toxin family protein, partial [Spirochaetaceae bacterium]|nr:nucleotidyl transferase AbiEii/AbiGii toxin family protein [Spirochaetaceae bacterium]